MSDNYLLDKALSFIDDTINAVPIAVKKIQNEARLALEQEGTIQFCNQLIANGYSLLPDQNDGMFYFFKSIDASVYHSWYNPLRYMANYYVIEDQYGNTKYKINDDGKVSPTSPTLKEQWEDFTRTWKAIGGVISTAVNAGASVYRGGKVVFDKFQEIYNMYLEAEKNVKKVAETLEIIQTNITMVENILAAIGTTYALSGIQVMNFEDSNKALVEKLQDQIKELHKMADKLEKLDKGGNRSNSQNEKPSPADDADF
jgi:hypothetical protein